MTDDGFIEYDFMIFALLHVIQMKNDENISLAQ